MPSLPVLVQSDMVPNGEWHDEPSRSKREIHDILSAIENFFKKAWLWILRAAHDVNDETLYHPFFMIIGLLVIAAWPHILSLPVWFAKDGYRRMEHQTRNATGQVTSVLGAPGMPPPRVRKRDAFIARYRAIVSATYEPQPTSRGAPLFGGTPLSSGKFAIESDRGLPIILRIIRWVAVVWATFIFGREIYLFIILND